LKDGICRVGLTKEELVDLAISGIEKRAAKCSMRDLPLFVGYCEAAETFIARIIASIASVCWIFGIAPLLTQVRYYQ